MSRTNSERFYKFLYFTAGMTYLLIVVGGIVRVTGSGLGCPDWPTCFGRWVPPLQINAIIEYTHRLVATLTSPLILACAVIAWRQFPKVKAVKRPLIWVIFLLGFQGLLGGVVVLMETPPDLVAVHLGNALLILALIIVPGILVRLKGESISSETKINFNYGYGKTAVRMTFILFIVLVSGAFVAGSDATYACSGWPLCNGQLFPAHPLGWIHMTHRLLVLLASIYIVMQYHQASQQEEQSRKTALVTVVLFFLQALVGALKVSYAFPIWLLGLHVAIAAAVWAAQVVVFSLAGYTDTEQVS
ncbi:MAG: COX15/CtaA family protein [Chloroflexota bacterium]